MNINLNLSFTDYLRVKPRREEWGGTLNFHFDIGKQPERPNQGANEWATAEFETVLNGISEQNVPK